MGFDNQSFVGKIGTKKRQKLEMKAEKRAYREVCQVSLNGSSVFL